MAEALPPGGNGIEIDADDPVEIDGADSDEPVAMPRRRGPGRAARGVQMAGPPVVVVLIATTVGMLHAWDLQRLGLPADLGPAGEDTLFAGIALTRCHLLPESQRGSVSRSAAAMLREVLRSRRPAHQIAHLVYEVLDVCALSDPIPIANDLPDYAIIEILRGVGEARMVLREWSNSALLISPIRVVTRLMPALLSAIIDAVDPWTCLHVAPLGRRNPDHRLGPFPPPQAELRRFLRIQRAAYDAPVGQQHRVRLRLMMSREHDCSP